MFKKNQPLVDKLKGFAAFQEELINTSLLSRFAPDYFPKNLHYAFTYWDEHRENFENFLLTMLAKDTVIKLIVNATEVKKMLTSKFQ